MNWKKVKLTSICKPKQWKTISTSEFQNEGFPVYGANGKIGFYKEYTHEQETLLVTCRGATCGSINICEPKSYVNGNAMALDNLITECNLKFLYHYLGKRGFNDVISGSAQPQITGQGLSKIEIPLPDLTTQQHIAQVLDQADALRQQNRQLLAYYDELLQSTFIELFGDPVKNEKGWEVKKLGEVCDKITDGTHKTPNYQSDGVTFISAKNIKNGEIDWSDLKFITKDEHNQLFKRCNPEYGDILITKSGSIGMAAIIKEHFEFSLFESLALLKPKTEIINYYLRELINSNDLVYQFIKGVGVKHLHLTDLRSLIVPIPPLPLQQHFAKIVEEIEAHKSLVQQSLAESEALFEGLLAEYFG